MKWLRVLQLLPLLFLAIPGRVCAQITITLDSTVLEAREVATDLVNPWDMVWGPAGEIWFSTRPGYLMRVHPDVQVVDTLHFISEVHESSVENSGLHALALHPLFPDSPFVYTHYTYDSLAARLVRWTFDPGQNALVDSLHLIPFMHGARSHIGSRIQFDTDSTFFLSIGDAYRFGIAQDTFSYNGKVIRLGYDGRIPQDNPFPNSATWSLGHRNPQGLFLAPNGILYSSEHGENDDDELNIIEKGRNYGWPLVAGRCDDPGEIGPCQSLNVREPIYSWSPTWAPCGMEYYDSPAIPEWRNTLLLCFLKAWRLKALGLSASGDSIVSDRDPVAGIFYRLRDVLVAADGRVFLCTSNHEKFNPPFNPGDDKIIELRNPNFVRLEEEQIQTVQSLKVFPNPARGHFALDLSPLQPGKYRWKICNQFGQVIDSGEGNWSPGNKSPQFDLLGQPSGFYFLQLHQNSRQWIGRLLLSQNP